MSGNDTVWGHRVSILPSLSFKKPAEIEIVLDGPNDFIHSYSTFDEITGHVNLKFEKDTCIDDFAITLQGQTSTWVEKIATTSPTMGRTTGKHTFLRVQQPIDQSSLPEYNRAIAGETYVIPFKFVVPDRILDFACSHNVDSDHVRSCHLQLPPSIGDPMLSGQGNTLMNDLAPNMAKISYSIRVGVLKALPKIRKTDLVEESIGIRIVPARDELPPLSIDSTSTPFSGKYSLRKEKNVRRGILSIGKKRGVLTAETLQPASLKLHHPAQSSDEPVTTMTKVQLRFDPTSADEQPPSLNNVTSKLKCYTFFGAAPWTYFPGPEGYDIYSTIHSMYPNTIDLSTRNLSNVEWRKHEPNSSSSSALRGNSVSAQSASERRPSKPTSTSMPRTYSAGTHGSCSTTDNHLCRRASTFSTASSTSTFTTSESNSSSSSNSEASSTNLDQTTLPKTTITPSASYNPSLPYYTTSIIVPITLPTPTSLSSSSSSPPTTTSSPATSRRPSAISTTFTTTTTASTSTSKPPSKRHNTKPITFIPTFHSCLISRLYSLELSIHATSAPTIHLRLPLQLSLPYTNPPPQSPPLTQHEQQNNHTAWFDPFALDNDIDNENDEAIARALSSSPQPTSPLDPNPNLESGPAPNYEDTYRVIGREGGGSIPDPTRHQSLPFSPTIPRQPLQQVDEAPPEYHSTVRRVSAARRTTMPAVVRGVSSNASSSVSGSRDGAERSERRIGQSNTNVNTKGDRRRFSFMHGM